MKQESLKDFERFYAMSVDPEVMQYIGDGSVFHWTREVALEKFRGRISGQDNNKVGNLAVYRGDCNLYIGWCGFSYSKFLDHIELGYRYSRDSWCKGYATEAASAILAETYQMTDLDEILACVHPDNIASIRVLVGGLGMGFTLRAVLDNLPPTGKVVVAELNPVVLDWCLRPLVYLTDGAARDSRVMVKACDVALLIRKYAKGVGGEKLDAVILDLYTGPYTRTHKKDDPIYGSTAINATRTALKPGGIFAVWGEDYDAGFERRLRAAGFVVTVERPGRSGPRHVVYMGKTPTPGKKVNRKGKKGPLKR